MVVKLILIFIDCRINSDLFCVIQGWFEGFHECLQLFHKQMTQFINRKSDFVETEKAWTSTQIPKRFLFSVFVLFNKAFQSGMAKEQKNVKIPLIF